MQKNIVLFLILSLIFACTNNNTDKNVTVSQKDTASGKEPPTASAETPKSLPSETSQSVGNTTVKINYTAPAVRGRAVWGALVPYNKVWVTGAHMATTLEIGKAFHMGGKTIAAGKYALFTIPGKNQWIVILNKNWNQHQADQYKESEDLIRLKVKPQPTAEMVERLKYEIKPMGERTADISMSWEKLRIPFSIEIR